MTVIQKNKINSSNRNRNRNRNNNKNPKSVAATVVAKIITRNPSFVVISISVLLSVILVVSASILFFQDSSSSSSSNRYTNTANMKSSAGGAAVLLTKGVSAATAVSPINIVKRKQSYELLRKTKLSHDSFLLRYGLPKGQQILGIDPKLPTCLKIDYHVDVPVPNNSDNCYNNDNNNDSVDNEGNTNTETTTTTTTKKILSKSYSPVTHPNQKGYFDLIVKSYPINSGGGVGKYLCDMPVGHRIDAKLKAERIMHGSSSVLHRGWNHVGLIAGGTGIAPLIQIARILLEEEYEEDNDNNDDDNNNNTNNTRRHRRPRIHLLFVNHKREDILGRQEIEGMAREYPDNFFVTYSLTNEDEDEDENVVVDENDDDGIYSASRFLKGRGDVEMAKAALPPPSSSSASSLLSSTDDDKNGDDENTDDNNNNTTDTMILVCGRDGFVAHWAGPVARAPPLPDGSKGPKIQGPLLGVLADAGYTAEQVFKY